MNLASVKPGDLVEVDKRGRRFFAHVEEKSGSQLDIRPMDRHETYRTATAREVVGIWHRSRQNDRARIRREAAELDEAS